MNHPRIRLSYSALNEFLSCERKFQLDRLLLNDSPVASESSALILGKAWGAGVAHYLEHQNRDAAIFLTWHTYHPTLLDDKRSREHCISLLLSAFPVLDSLLEEWELAHFQSKPATELSFALDIDEVCYYVGYVDAILRNRFTGRYAILENKTTAMNLSDLSPLYANSGQAIGYSIVLDKIVGEEQSQYDVLYLVGQLPNKIQVFHFPKTIQDRLNWFLSIGLDCQRLHSMLELNVFPLRGQSCLRYNRPCRHFGVCSLHGLDRPKDFVPDTIEYQFRYNLNEVIENHLERIAK